MGQEELADVIEQALARCYQKADGGNTTLAEARSKDLMRLAGLREIPQDPRIDPGVSRYLPLVSVEDPEDGKRVFHYYCGPSGVMVHCLTVYNGSALTSEFPRLDELPEKLLRAMRKALHHHFSEFRRVRLAEGGKAAEDDAWLTDQFLEGDGD